MHKKGPCRFRCGLFCWKRHFPGGESCAGAGQGGRTPGPCAPRPCSRHKRGLLAPALPGIALMARAGVCPAEERKLVPGFWGILTGICLSGSCRACLLPGLFPGPLPGLPGAAERRERASAGAWGRAGRQAPGPPAAAFFCMQRRRGRESAAGSQKCCTATA